MSDLNSQLIIGDSMPAQFEIQDGLFVARITGQLQKSELDRLQWTGISSLDPSQKLRVLVLAETFEGWQKGDEWGDVSFTSEFGDRIEKMAIVVDSKWKDQVLMFTGAGFRSTQIRTFATGEIAAARAWLRD